MDFSNFKNLAKSENFVFRGPKIQKSRILVIFDDLLGTSGPKNVSRGVRAWPDLARRGQKVVDFGVPDPWIFEIFVIFPSQVSRFSKNWLNCNLFSRLGEVDPNEKCLFFVNENKLFSFGGEKWSKMGVFSCFQKWFKSR